MKTSVPADGARRPMPGPMAGGSARFSLVGTVVVCAAIALGACGGGTATTSPTTRPNPTPTDPVTPATQTQASVSSHVIVAYQTMWTDLVTAAETSDFQSPLLPQHATGEALTLLVQGLARVQLHDIVTRGVTVHRPVLTSMSPTPDPTHATVADCFDDTRWIEYTTDGKRAKNTPGGRRATTADLVKKVNTWKVSQLTIGATGTC